jgi:hypothetical protein
MGRIEDLKAAKIEDYQGIIDEYLNEFSVRTNGFVLPRVKYETTLENTQIQSKPDFFIGIPVKNQENIITQVIEHLMMRLSSPTEIGLLFDNCTDHSRQRALDFVSNEMGKYSNIVRVHFLKSEDELFESTCENLLFKMSNATYLVSFQADILLLDETFFERCKVAFSKIENLLGLSGRATVPLIPIKSLRMKIISSLSVDNILTALLPRYFNKRGLGPFLKGFSYFGDTSGFPNPKMKFSKNQINSVYLGQAIIRGPIVWSAVHFKKLGGFNDISYFLGRDDCNLSLEGLRDNLRVGYLPCEQTSNPEDGTTRKERTPSVQLSLQERTNLSKMYPGSVNQFWELPYWQRRKFLKNYKFSKIKI